jgi:glycosyltransferase involved in cell wall biosynthesis
MKSSKMFVLPSAREGFGLVVVEANACNIPVITTKHKNNAASSLILEGQNGYLAELDVQHLARQIRSVLKAQGLMPAETLKTRFASYRWHHAAEAVEKAFARS